MIKVYCTYGKIDSAAFIKKSVREYGYTENITVLYTENGKPYAENNPVFVSISHSDELTVCAVSKANIGTDAEKIRKIKSRDKISSRFFNTVCKSDREFLYLWTAFESKIKYYGEKLFDCPKAREQTPKIFTKEIDGYIISVCTEISKGEISYEFV